MGTVLLGIAESRLAKSIANYEAMDRDWSEEEGKKGNDHDKDYAIRCCRMLIVPLKGWLMAERQLLELEKRLGEHTKEAKKSHMKGKRKHG